jgi:predicted dehydrogenase
MRWGIIGCGLIGGKRAKAVQALGDKVVVVADVVVSRANRLAAEVDAQVAPDWREVAARADLDAVVVATSHDSLSTIAVSCVSNGKHVLLEKPAGCNLADVRVVGDAARRSSRLVKVGFNHRFHPGLKSAKRLITEGAIGPLYYIRGRYGHGGRIGYEKEWRCNRAFSGGGELIDQGSHLIDLSRWLLGDLTLEYSAAPTYYWDIDVEDNCFLALRGANGALAWLHATWTEWKNMFSFEIVGRDGKLTVDGLGGSYGTERLTFHRMLPQLGPPETTIWEYPFPDASWDAELRSFAAAVAGNSAEIADIEDACAMWEIIEAVYARDAA